QRRVMVSTALDGASHEEIAAALGLSSGSVRGLIYRARSTLRAAAAAVIPAPVVEWALGDVGGASAGLAGAGSAGLGALILKGGAILAVGAVAGTTAIVAGVPSHGHHALKGSSTTASARQSAGARAASDRVFSTGPGGAGNPTVLAARRTPLRAGGRDGSRDGGSSRG